MLGKGASPATRGPQRPQREAGTSSSQTGLLSELINPQITYFPKGQGLRVFPGNKRPPEGGRPGPHLCFLDFHHISNFPFCAGAIPRGLLLTYPISPPLSRGSLEYSVRFDIREWRDFPGPQKEAGTSSPQRWLYFSHIFSFPFCAGAREIRDDKMAKVGGLCRCSFYTTPLSLSSPSLPFILILLFLCIFESCVVDQLF